MKIALVHDDLIQHGGAERVFKALVGLFPRADVLTSMATETWLEGPSDSSNPGFQSSPKARHFSSGGFYTSFMQKFPFKKKLYRAYFPLYPFAFESFNFTEYDLVISSSSRFAHGIITKPGTTHICYMHSPGRMWWEPGSYFHSREVASFSSRSFWLAVRRALPGFAEAPAAPELQRGELRPGEKGTTMLTERTVEAGHAPQLQLKLISPFLSWLRQWDYTAAQRVNYFIANSNSVKERINKFYNRESTIIYPFVDLNRFRQPATTAVEEASLRRDLLGRKILDPGGRGIGEVGECGGISPTAADFFLIVSRLARWKRFDIAIKACNKLKQPLVVVGEGPDRRRLEKLAGPTIKFLGRLSDEDVVKCFKQSRALIFPQKEDFGITPLEAMAAGKPVIAYKEGGALETILPGETGEFFYPQSVRALADAISKFDARRFRADVCREQAAKFGKTRFEDRILEFIERII